MNIIIHFILDEKITDQLIDNFKSVNEECIFLVFKNENDTFKYLTSSGKHIIEYDDNVQCINSIIETYKSKAIIVHGLQLAFAKCILKIKSEVRIAWIEWGFDVYGLPKIRPSTYAPKTNSYLLKSHKKLWIERVVKKRDWLRDIYAGIIMRQQDNYSVIFNAIKRIDFFCTYIKEDFTVFSSFYPNNLKFLSFTFNSIEQYLAGRETVKIDDSAKGILIGNSNTPENNHIDVLETLGCFKSRLTDVYIYTPLSYGKNEKYKNVVIKIGASYFKSMFTPLLDFMDRSEYIEILRSCSVGIFYHYRQQGMGNIIAMLYMGCRIYLSTKNPVYHFFKRIGVFVFDFDSEFEVYANSRLEKKYIENNRKVLNVFFSKEKVKSDILRLNSVLGH